MSSCGPLNVLYSLKSFILGSKAKGARISLKDANIRHKNTTRTQTGTSETPSSLLRQSSPVGRLSTPDPGQSSPVRKLSPISLQSGPSWLNPESEFDIDSSQSTLETLLRQPPTMKKSINSSNPVDNADRTLDYHKNKKKKQLDDSDHLFMSYAKSYKRLSVRNQVKIKLALAKLFAEAELDEFENNSTNEQATNT